MKYLEEHSHKVDSTWRETKIIKWPLGEWENIFKAKISPEWDIYEYISWVPDDIIWEQLFSWKAIERLWLQDRLPDEEHIQEISKWKPCGVYDPWYKSFNFVWIYCACLLSDWDYVCIEWEYHANYTNNNNYFLSVYLLKRTFNLREYSDKELLSEIERRLIECDEYF